MFLKHELRAAFCVHGANQAVAFRPVEVEYVSGKAVFGDGVANWIDRNDKRISGFVDKGERDWIAPLHGESIPCLAKGGCLYPHFQLAMVCNLRRVCVTRVQRQAWDICSLLVLHNEGMWTRFWQSAAMFHFQKSYMKERI